ncbi:MAG: hypothetical protein Q7U99_10575 [Rubrivivax sp.]|nr:hypothetical protein [Rubrivivax sp.]MDP3225021.1 hypothetical protein [Rubrivivax sp.]
MKVRDLCSKLVLTSLLMGAGASQAAGGLATPPADTVWPQWQARVTLVTQAMSPLNLWGLQDGPLAARTGRGGAVLGDYYFAQPSMGSFRASGGVMFGSFGGAPLGQAASSPRLGLAMQGTSTTAASTETAGTVPYLGLGFTTAWRDRLSLSADLGWVAEQPSAMGGVGRAIFGNQRWESALRDIGLAPVLQLGVRYAF